LTARGTAAETVPCRIYFLFFSVDICHFYDVVGTKKAVRVGSRSRVPDCDKQCQALCRTRRSLGRAPVAVLRRFS
jgi:hypothetical protein